MSLSNPSVCAILLTADRPEMTKQAIASFRAQTYKNKVLVVYDSGRRCGFSLRANEDHIYAGDSLEGRRATIGELRNSAIDELTIGDTAEILIHWDSDDVSHPNRITEQVELLQSSGADIVGYNQMLFWREGTAVLEANTGLALGGVPGEAWLYTNNDRNYALGTSLCYWRKTWERKPFEAVSAGEDIRFTCGLKCFAVSSMADQIPPPEGCGIAGACYREKDSPRMVARIHSANTSQAYRRDLMCAQARQSNIWQLTPQWDEFCRGVFAGLADGGYVPNTKPYLVGE